MTDLVTAAFADRGSRITHTILAASPARPSLLHRLAVDAFLPRRDTSSAPLGWRCPLRSAFLPTDLCRSLRTSGQICRAHQSRPLRTTPCARAGRHPDHLRVGRDTAGRFRTLPRPGVRPPHVQNGRRHRAGRPGASSLNPMFTTKHAVRDWAGRRAADRDFHNGHVFRRA